MYSIKVSQTCLCIKILLERERKDSGYRCVKSKIGLWDWSLSQALFTTGPTGTNADIYQVTDTWEPGIWWLCWGAESTCMCIPEQRKWTSGLPGTGLLYLVNRSAKRKARVFPFIPPGYGATSALFPPKTWFPEPPGMPIWCKFGSPTMLPNTGLGH